MVERDRREYGFVVERERKVVKNARMFVYVGSLASADTNGDVSSQTRSVLERARMNIFAHPELASTFSRTLEVRCLTV